MTTYHIIAERRVNSNTAEHGYGDYPETIKFVACTVEAETLRKAQNAAKKMHPNRFSFGGGFGNLIYTDADLPSIWRNQ
jgi:hypothetical protein